MLTVNLFQLSENFKLQNFPFALKCIKWCNGLMLTCLFYLNLFYPFHSHLSIIYTILNSCFIVLELMKYCFVCKGKQRKMTAALTYPLVQWRHHSSPVRKEIPISKLLFKKLIWAKRQRSLNLRHASQMSPIPRERIVQTSR